MFFYKNIITMKRYNFKKIDNFFDKFSLKNKQEKESNRKRSKYWKVKVKSFFPLSLSIELNDNGKEVEKWGWQKKTKE